MRRVLKVEDVEVLPAIVCLPDDVVLLLPLAFTKGVLGNITGLKTRSRPSNLFGQQAPARGHTEDRLLHP